MNFTLSNSHKELINAIDKTIEEFDDNYWLNADNNSKFPIEFVKKIADGGWLGIAMPSKYGGSDLCVTEASQPCKFINWSILASEDKSRPPRVLGALAPSTARGMAHSAVEEIVQSTPAQQNGDET